MKTQKNIQKDVSLASRGGIKTAALSFSYCVSGEDLCAAFESAEALINKEKELSESVFTVEAETAGTAFISVDSKETSESGFSVIRERLYAFHFTVGGVTEKKGRRGICSDSSKKERVFVPRFVNRGARFLRL